MDGLDDLGAQVLDAVHAEPHHQVVAHADRQHEALREARSLAAYETRCKYDVTLGMSCRQKKN